MTLWGDERGQSVQVGAVLLFGVLIVLLSTYQAFIVPDQNQQVEFNHNQEVQSQLQELRNTVVSLSNIQSSQAVSLQLGTRYPSRVLAFNPGSPTGSIRTNGTENPNHNVTIRHASAASETGDYWTGSPRHVTTGTLVYSPNYNVYGNAPTTYYEHSVVYNQFREGAVTLSGQTLVDGRDLQLIALNGSLSRTSSGTTTVDISRESSTIDETRTVAVSNTPGTNVSVSFLSRLPAATWKTDLLAEEFDETPTNGGSDDDRYVAEVTQRDGPGPFYNITLVFERGVDYRLRMAKAGVGTKVSDEDATYLTNVTRNGTTVREGETIDVVVEARDAYNNPIPDVTVNATDDASGGGVGSSVTTNDDGRATFTFDASGVSPGTYYVDTSFRAIDGDYAASGQENVTLEVVVQSSSTGGGSSAYSVGWTRPSFAERIVSEELSDQTQRRATQLQVRATDGSDPVSGMAVDYGVGDPAVVQLRPGDGETDTTGYNETNVGWQQDGFTTLYAGSGGASDATPLTVDRLLNDSFEDSEETLVSNGWYYNDSDTPGSGDAGIQDIGSAPADSRVASISGDAGSGDRAIELNYSLDTSSYDAFTLTYAAREPSSGDNPDTPDSGGNWVPGENLYVQYRASDDSWVTVDNVSSQTDGSEPITYERRVVIEGVDNASHSNFAIRFVQRETTAEDEWQIDAVDVIGLSTSEVTGRNQAPVPAFRYSPTSPSTSDTVTFDAGRSDDPDDSDIASYEWDWTSDGTYDTTGKTASHVYSTDGTYTATLRVTDGRGGTATTSQTVTVGSGGDGGSQPSIDTFSVSDTSDAGPPNKASYTVDWSVSDPDGDLQSVTVYLNETSPGSNVVDQGSGASGTLSFEDGGGTSGNTYEFKIIARDVAGNENTQIVTDTADGTDP